MKNLLLLLAALSSNPAEAGPDDAEWNPPPKYRKVVKIPVKVAEMDPWSLQGACFRLYGRHAAGQYFRGCSVLFKGKECYIFMIDRPSLGTTPQAVFRHEMGHCAGWPQDHSN